ncbi:zinc finger BED domain-containing protein RICESLEEPER 2 [Tanacetum coccineum]
MASESASASTATGVGSTSAPTIREIIATNRNPQIWKDFNLCIMTDNSQKAQCKHCFHFLSVGSNTTLRNHITHPHCEAKKAQQNQNPEAGQTSMARDGSVFRYDPDYLREQFAGLVIQRALPFNHFDHEQTTRVFQNTMQPRYTHSAPHGVPDYYICVTAHWIEPVLTNFNLEDKVMSIILDNASNNTSVMDKLKLKYEPPMGAALNPCFNVNGVDFLIESISTNLEVFDDSFASKSKSYFKESLKGLYNLYYAKYDNPTQSSQTSGRATSSKASGGNNEYEQYVNSDFVTHLHPKEFATFDVLGFWKEKETMYHVLSRMVMDIISVQASSIASEFAFSTSGRVLSIRRTRLTPAFLEMCMCLKDHVDAKERKQDKSPLEIPLDFEEDVLDDEVQRNKVIPLSDEEIALDASSEGTLSPGGPRYDYMMSSEEAEDDY